VFIAASSWLVDRIGAVNTALLVIGGQMVSGVLLDLIRAAPGNIWARAAGVALIIAGMALTQRRRA
jgi:bacterial/archaeal transporter family-2 protein